MSKRPLIIVDSSTFSPVFSLSLCLSVVSAQTRITQTTPLKCTMAFLWISRALSRLSAADNSLYCALELTISANRLLPCQSHFKFPISHTHTQTSHLNSMVHLLIRAHLVNSKYRHTYTRTHSRQVSYCTWTEAYTLVKVCCWETNHSKPIDNKLSIKPEQWYTSPHPGWCTNTNKAQYIHTQSP